MPGAPGTFERVTDQRVPASSVPIRPAATVMLVRDGDAGLEVFMLQRTHAAVFAKGIYVFPGGKVDSADAGPAFEAAVRRVAPGVEARVLAPGEETVV